MMDTDRFLAERLMGWVEGTHFAFEIYGSQGEFSNVFLLGPDGGVKCIWSPSGNITQALGDGGPGTVVGAMREKGFSLSLQYLEIGWEASFTNSEGRFLIGSNIEAFGTGDTPSAAISLAAERALKGEG